MPALPSNVGDLGNRKVIPVDNLILHRLRGAFNTAFGEHPLRNSGASVPGIATIHHARAAARSASGDGRRLKGFRVGAVDYIPKPFDIEKVQARVETRVNCWSGPWGIMQLTTDSSCVSDGASHFRKASCIASSLTGFEM